VKYAFIQANHHSYGVRSTAKAMGLNIPSALLLRADRVINECDLSQAVRGSKLCSIGRLQLASQTSNYSIERMVARDFNRWLKRNKHVAGRHATPGLALSHDSRRR